MTEVSLDTTIATMILIRSQVQGPITVLVPHLTERIQRKLYRAHVDDIIEFPLLPSVFRPLIQQRLWTYHYPQMHSLADDNTTKNDPVITTGSWEINQETYTVTKNDKTIALTPKEFQLLSYLVDHKGQVLNRDQLVNGSGGTIFLILHGSLIFISATSAINLKMTPNTLLTFSQYGDLAINLFKIIKMNTKC